MAKPDAIVNTVFQWTSGVAKMGYFRFNILAKSTHTPAFPFNQMSLLY